MKNICDPSEEEASVTKIKSCWVNHEISRYKIYTGNSRKHRTSVWTWEVYLPECKCVSDKSPGKLVFQKEGI